MKKNLLLLLMAILAIPMLQANKPEIILKGSKTPILTTMMKSEPFGAKQMKTTSTTTWDFEDPNQINDWTFVDNDGDGFNWEYHNNAGLHTSLLTCHSGNGIMISRSYSNEYHYALSPDNWMISPVMKLGGTLKFWAMGQDPSFCSEVFAVYVCVGNSTDINNFVKIGSNCTATGEYVEYEFDLAAYQGQMGCFAIRHFNVSDMFMLNIDDVSLSESRSINFTVNLSRDVNPADYANMWLELTNTQNGQKMHYVITDKSSYKFSNIIGNSTWNVVLRNPNGGEFGRIDNVAVHDNDVTVTFDTLSKPCKASLSVLTPSEQDVTSSVDITWIDSFGNIMAHGPSVTGQPLGAQLRYILKLPQELAVAYVQPDITEYTVTDGDNAIVCRLEDLALLQVSGKVKDANTGLPLYDANITASQTICGKYDKTMNTNSNKDGTFSLEMANVSTTVVVASSAYITQTIECDLASGDGPVVLQDILLQPITGATVTVDFNYSPVHAEGESAEAQNWYSDYNNVDYTIHNKTTGRDITDISVQYPLLVLLEDVNDGDVLELTVSSRKDAFKPVKSTVTIAEQKATATFNIVEKGQITAKFIKNDNPAVVGTLYDANGKLLNTYQYRNDASLTIPNLNNGRYTLVTMGDSQFFNTIYDLSQLPLTGLASDVDYVQSTVEVIDGIISAVTIDEVPTLDETKFYYTGENTSFTVNKSSIVIGNYLTLKGRLDFKPAYAEQVNNVSLIVDIPENCVLLGNSVMVGSTPTACSVDGNRITIPMLRHSDLVRFCVLPTAFGDYAPSAFVQFDIDGETITQPIGSVNFTSLNLSINVPPCVCDTTITVSGTAYALSAIDVYDNDVLIAHTTSLSNGYWSTKCELYKPYNLSSHRIYAEATTTEGLKLKTETANCLYDLNLIKANSVVILYDNPEMGPYNIVFDLINETVTPAFYYFFPYKSWPDWRDSGTEPKAFTFVADLTINDPTKVNAVKIKVFTDHKHWRNLQAFYDPNINKWVATDSFTVKDLPVGVKVQVVANREIVMDGDQLVSVQDEVPEVMADIIEEKEHCDDILTLINAELSKESPDYEVISELLADFGMPNAEGVDDVVLDEMDDDSFDDYVNQLCSQVDAFIDNQELDLYQIISEYESLSQFEINFLNQKYSISITEPYTLDESVLIADGFTQIPTTTDYTVYEKYEGSDYIRIDVTRNICVKMSISATEAQFKSIISEEELAQILSAIMDAVNSLKFTAGKIEEFVLWCNFNLSSSFKEFLAEDSRVANQLLAIEKRLPEATGFRKFILLEEKARLTAQRAALTAKWNVLSKNMQNIARCAGAALTGLTSLVTCLMSEYENCEKVASLVVPYCLYEKAPNVAFEHKMEIYSLFEFVRSWAFWTIARTAAYVIGDVVLSESVVIPILLSIAECGAELLYARAKQEEFDDKYQNLKYRIKESVKKYCKDEDDDDEEEEPHPLCQPIHDPSGFVYEGVPSNRLQDVMTTCYHKKTIEDMYGDLHEEVVLWDAEQYGQENPLFTDERGYYRWDVPVGLWQVKYEKEGYETAYSDWLPVPPPQLDVNIGMVQMRQPEVIKARAYPQAVELEFDKFMMPETLTEENITVSVDGTAVSGTIEVLNAEVDDPNAITSLRRAPGTGLTLASKVRFNADRPFNADKVTLHVNHDVESYAGVQMNDDYEVVLPLEYEMTQIVADSLINVIYGDTHEMIVTVEPAFASKGKTLNVRSFSSMIISTDAETYTLDNNGQAVITVHGDLPGMSSLLFGIDGYDLSAATLVKVVMESEMTVATPTASIASGSEVAKGTEVYLYCATEGATIYYTLDGSCPCDNTDSRMVYDGSPIIIDHNVTIKAMAVAEGMYDSDVATFTYRVKGGLRGDVNGDGAVNIADINKLIDYILRDLINSETLERGDVNGDNTINIGDINAVIQIILGPGTGARGAKNTADLLHMNDLTLQPGETGTLHVTVDNAVRYSALQCDIVLPDGLTLVDATATGSIVETGVVNDNTSRAVTYSMSLLPFVGDSQPVLTLTVRADVTLADMSHVTLTNVVLADMAGVAWYAGDCTAMVNNATGINELSGSSKEVASVRYYNVAGQEMSRPAGMTIQVTTYTDGTRSATRLMK